jgi:tyrosyl-tRNA synthetase
MKEHEQDQSKRVAQHKLAREFVELVHGLGAAQQAEEEHRTLFKKGLSISDIQQSINQTAPDAAIHGNETLADLHPRLNKHAKPQDMQSNSSTQTTLPRSLVKDQPLSRILYSAGLTASRGEGQRLINAGGVYIGAQSSGKGEMSDSVSYIPAKDAAAEFVAKYIIDNNLLILRTGKWKMKVISIVSDEEFRTERLTCPGWDFETGNPTKTTPNTTEYASFGPFRKRQAGRY